jgi:cytochrome b6-f complex iron-sulfur subunit
MPSIDPERPPTGSVGRRDFLAAAARVLLWVTGGSAAVGLARYLSYEPPSARPTRFTLEDPQAYPKGARAVVRDAGAVVCRDAEGFYARSLICSHLGCRVRPSEDGGFACPCHGSRFSGDGACVQGPAGRNLQGLALGLDDQGRLVLDLSAPVDPAWRLRVGTAMGSLSWGRKENRS